MRTNVALCAAVIAAVQPASAMADAATHQLTLLARNVRSDCMHGNCEPTCLIKGRLTSVRDASVPMQIAFRYRQTNGPDNPNASFTLNFPALAPKASNSGAVDHVLGLYCKKVIVDRVEVTCPDSTERCPGFYFIQIPSSTAPRILKQKVEGK